MRMTQQDQTTLQAAIEKHGITPEFKLALMLVQKENRRAQAWRVFQYVNKLEGYALSDSFYAYLNDSHIETALMKILYSEAR